MGCQQQSGRETHSICAELHPAMAVCQDGLLDDLQSSIVEGLCYIEALALEWCGMRRHIWWQAQIDGCAWFNACQGQPQPQCWERPDPQTEQDQEL